MESIIIILLVLGLVQALSERGKKKKAAKPQTVRQTTAGKTPSARPASSGSLGADSMEGRDTCDPSLGHASPHKPLQPTTPFAPPARPVISGSTASPSMEGRDTCDPSLGHAKVRPAATPTAYDAPEYAGPRLEMNAQTILQGVVMSEILTRPAQRKWGRLYRR
ncbi:MAG TPA: hypothetical protein IAC48_05370 [Candidatus Limiplasma stercoravium]|nr:hypothetical protein [Candidatus Limiplasma stercoravium]